MCVCFVPCLCKGWFCRLAWEKICIWEEFWSFEELMTETDRPEVTLALAVPFNRGNIEGTKSSQICICFVPCLCEGWFCRLAWEKICIWEKFWRAYDRDWSSWGNPGLRCALLTGVILKGLNLHKFVYVLFHVCVRAGFVDWLEKRFVYEKSFEVLKSIWQKLPGSSRGDSGLMCSFNRGNTEGTKSSQICVCFVSWSLCKGWFCRLAWEKVCIWEEFWRAYDRDWSSWGDRLRLTGL